MANKKVTALTTIEIVLPVKTPSGVREMPGRVREGETAEVPAELADRLVKQGVCKAS